MLKILLIKYQLFKLWCCKCGCKSGLKQVHFLAGLTQHRIMKTLITAIIQI